MPVMCLAFSHSVNLVSCDHEDHGTHPKTDIIRALPYLWSSDRRSL